MSEQHTEWYRRHRPKKLSQIIGQPDAVKTIEKLFAKGFPHALLLTGSSGTGKTTTARVLQLMLKCSDMDFAEINAADTRGIDTIRDIKQRAGLAPINGPCRIFLLDECFALTKDSQNSLLKLLEDPPPTAYFFLCATETQKILPTIKTRCTEIKFKPLSTTDLDKLLTSVSDKENIELPESVKDRIIEVVEGSARKALVILQQVAHLESEEEQLDAILKSDSRTQAIDLARSLFDFRSKWPDVARILKELPEEEVETTRRLVLSYANSILLKGGKLASRAAEVINVFSRNLFDSGKPGLCANCFEFFGKG